MANNYINTNALKKDDIIYFRDGSSIACGKIKHIIKQYGIIVLYDGAIVQNYCNIYASLVDLLSSIRVLQHGFSEEESTDIYAKHDVIFNHIKNFEQ